MMNSFFLFIIILVSSLSVHAQNPQWLTYTSGFGSSVGSIVSQGSHVWVSWEGGLTRIDITTGQMTLYNRENTSMQLSHVGAMSVGPDGALWIAASSGGSVGLLKFDGTNWTIYDTANSGLDGKVTALAVDHQGHVWVGVEKAGEFQEFDGKNWTTYHTPDTIYASYVEALAIDKHDNVLVSIGGGNGGLGIFNGYQWKIYNRDNSGLPYNTYNEIFSISVDSSGNYWLCTLGGLVEFDGTNWTVFSGLPDSWILATIVDGKGNRWVGTEFGGAAMYADSSWRTFNTSNSGLTSNSVNAIALDSLGHLWFGTYMGGLVTYDGSKWSQVRLGNSGLAGNSLSSVAIDREGNKWIATLGIYSQVGSINKFDGVNWSAFEPFVIRPHDKITSLMIDNKDNVYAGSLMQGLAGYDGQSWKTWSGSQLYAIFSESFDSAGNLWVGTINSLLKFDGTNWTHIKTVTAFSVYCDRAGNVWVGSQDEHGTVLYKFDGATWTTFNSGNSEIPATYGGTMWGNQEITMDKNGTLWIGTWDNGYEHAGGLVSFDGSHWNTWSSSNSGLPSDNVYCVAIDQAGNKWVGTTKGMAKFDGKNWTVYNENNSGLPMNEVTAIAIDSHGNKWITTNGGGLAVFNENGIVLDVKGQSGVVPSSISLHQNYPNPFNPSTTISYELPWSAFVVLTVYDVLGREVETLVNERQIAGSHSVRFDGSALPSGVYFYRLEAGTYHETKKLILLK